MSPRTLNSGFGEGESIQGTRPFVPEIPVWATNRRKNWRGAMGRARVLESGCFGPDLAILVALGKLLNFSEHHSLFGKNGINNNAKEIGFL